MGKYKPQYPKEKEQKNWNNLIGMICLAILVSMMAYMLLLVAFGG